MKITKYLALIGILLFAYIIYKLKITNIIAEIKSADISLLFLALFLMIITIMLQTFKWHVIAKKQNIDINFKQSTKINFISNFYGFITPSKIGGAIRALYLKEKTGNIGKGISNFVLDRMIDFASLFFIGIIAVGILQNKFNYLPISYLIGLFILVIIVIWIFVDKERTRKILRIFYKKFLPKSIKEKTKLTFDSFYEDMPKKRHFVLFFLVNLSFWIMTYIITYIVGLSLGIDIGFFYFMAIMPIVTVVALLPITINGFGTREAALISIFAMFNVAAAKVFSMSLLSLAITGLVPALIGLILMLKEKQLSWKD